MYLVDDSNKSIEFTNDEIKISILNFKIDIISEWTENLDQQNLRSKEKTDK